MNKSILTSRKHCRQICVDPPESWSTWAGLSVRAGGGGILPPVGAWCAGCEDVMKGHQGAPNINFRHYTLKKSELAKNWPSSGPRLSWMDNTRMLKGGIHLLKQIQIHFTWIWQIMQMNIWLKVLGTICRYMLKWLVFKIFMILKCWYQSGVKL